MKRLIAVSLVAVLLLVGMVAVPAVQAANELSLTGSVTVNEIVSITLTDAGTAGINFGSLNPPVTGQGDIAQSNGTAAVKVNVGSETNVNVDIGIKGVIAGGTLALSNWKYSTTFISAKTGLTGSYVAVYTDKAASSINDVYHWLDVPAGTASGSHTVTVSYKAVKTGTSF